MLAFLFRGLTADPQRGAALFEAVTRKARQSHWYVEGKVPDTIDGRFAVLATVSALVLTRLDQIGDEGNAASVALTERFIEVMESEHRELGLGDPSLGKQVRRLVGSLSRRTELWTRAVASDGAWTEATRESLYKGDIPAEALRHSAGALSELWKLLQGKSATHLAGGDLK